TVDELHREERRVARDHEIEEPDQPRRIDVGECAELGLDAHQRIERVLAEALERDGRSEREVMGLEHVAARSTPQAPNESVPVTQDLQIARHRRHPPSYNPRCYDKSLICPTLRSEAITHALRESR